MNKHIPAYILALIVWFSWFFRYDLGNYGLVLDRWTGNLISEKGAYKADLSDAKP